ncbi:uncharacterized protein [Macrobrachium rosenbergii]|uniref:uncharacterized protein n=1 Tax=Macrobrachium rosenbergii TaxID=79674 RepID=UPI0034D6A1A4
MSITGLIDKTKANGDLGGISRFFRDLVLLQLPSIQSSYVQATTIFYSSSDLFGHFKCSGREYLKADDPVVRLTWIAKLWYQEIEVLRQQRADTTTDQAKSNWSVEVR